MDLFTIVWILIFFVFLLLIVVCQKLIFDRVQSSVINGARSSRTSNNRTISTISGRVQEQNEKDDLPTYEEIIVESALPDYSTAILEEEKAKASSSTKTSVVLNMNVKVVESR